MEKNLTEKLYEELKKRNIFEEEDEEDFEDDENEGDEEDIDDEEDDQEEEDDDVEETTDNDSDNDLSDISDVNLYKINPKVIKILTNRIKDEYTAHYYYRAAANWCQDMNYKKAAEFFRNEADDELEHAKKIQEYMVDFNIQPVIPNAPTKHNFNNLIDIVHGAYEMELGLMKAYNKDSLTLFTSDITTFDFLTEFRVIQKGAVVEYNDLINASNLVDKTDKFQVLYFEQTYF
jgi:ferritin